MLVDPGMIVLADDDKYAVDFFKSAVKHIYRDFHLVTCESGDELLKYLDNPNNVRPRLVFLGVNMPIGPGLKNLEEIRQRYSSDEIPVAVYTNHANAAMRSVSKKLGADYCITKPTSSIILRNLIEQLVTQVESKGNKINC